MNTRLGRLLSLLLLAFAVCCGGETKTVVAETQLLLSVSLAPTLQSEVDRLRATVWTSSGGTWEQGSSVTVQTAGLSFPIDLPILPSTPAHERATVELVVEALAGTQVLAETRVLSRFVSGENRTLTATLSLCAGREPGFVCAPSSCRGAGCQVCAASGACEPVVEQTGGEPVQPIDAGSLPSDRDASGPAKPTLPADGGAVATVDAARVTEPRDAGAVSDMSDTGTADAGPAQGVCPADHGCVAPYACVPTKLGYTCRGQFADWPMPDGFAEAKFKHDYTTDGLTVVDGVTKLEWQTNVPLVHAGCTRFPMYSSGGVSMRGMTGEWCSLAEARAHCQELVYADKDDWRLPSLIELVSVFDSSRINHRIAIDGDVFPDVEWSGYVTNSLYARPTASYRGIDFVSREITESNQGEVRCVRGGAEPPFAKPTDRYTVDATADTVTDNATQLTWQRTPSAQVFVSDAPEIATHCKDGWRLPTPNELLTLVDPTREKPAIEPTAFPGTLSTTYWVMENDRGSAVSFELGDMEYSADDGLIRCVR